MAVFCGFCNFLKRALFALVFVLSFGVSISAQAACNGYVEYTVAGNSCRISACGETYGLESNTSYVKISELPGLTDVCSGVVVNSETGLQWVCIDGDAENSQILNPGDKNITFNKYPIVCNMPGYTITLDANNGSGGSSSVYTIKNAGVYLNNARTQIMTSSGPQINKPQRNDATFIGYYSSSSGGTQYVDGNGYITSDGINTGKGLTSNSTWYARYSCDTGYEWNSNSNSCQPIKCELIVYFDSDDTTRLSSVGVTMSYGDNYYFKAINDFNGSNDTQPNVPNGKRLARWDCGAGGIHIPGQTSVWEYAGEAGNCPHCVATYWPELTLDKNGGSGIIKVENTDYSNTNAGKMMCEPNTTITLPTWVSGTPANNQTNITNANRTFLGWSTNSSCQDSSCVIANSSVTCPTDGTTYYAVWAPAPCTVTFKNGNATLGTQTIQYSSSGLPSLTSLVNLQNYNANSSSLPSSAYGWSFSGWSLNFTDRVSYTNGQSVDVSNFCNNQSAVTLYGVWKRDVMFKHVTGETSSGFSTMNTSQTQLYYTNLSNTAVVQSVTVPTNGVLSNSANWNWALQGWVLNSTTGTTTEVLQNGSVTPAVGTNANYYALYSRSVTLSYNGNGNSGGSTSSTADTQYYNVGDTQAIQLNMTLAQNGFTKTGYNFNGWAPGSANGAPVYVASSSYVFRNRSWLSDSTYTMYAKWNPITYTVNFNTNGATGNPSTNSVTCTYDQDCPAFATQGTMLKNSSVFGGWNANQDGTGSNYSAGANNVRNLTTTDGATVNLYAQWSTCTSCTVNHAHDCEITVNNNSCAYSATCDTGYQNSVSDSGTSAYCASNSLGGVVTSVSCSCVPKCNKITLDNTTNGGSGGTTSLYKKTDNTAWYSDLNCTTSVNTLPNSPLKSGYAYNGHYADPNSAANNYITSGGGLSNTWTVTSPQTIYAQYTQTEITLTLDKSNGSGDIKNNNNITASGTTPGQMICQRGSSVTLPAWESSVTNANTTNIKKGTGTNSKVFLGWSTDEQCQGSSCVTNTITCPDANTTYYAVWGTPVCNITNGTGVVADTTNSNAPNCNVTCNCGYGISGDHRGAAGNTAVNFICNPQTITLNWANGGHGTAPTSPATCTYNSTFTMPAAMTETGYDFYKWRTSRAQFDAGDTNVACTQANLGVCSGSATITGEWIPNNSVKYTVYYYLQNANDNNYSFDSTDEFFGTTGATVTLADLVNNTNFTGFTYNSGFAGTSTNGSTKPSSGAVASTTILADGTRVIDLYYNRKLYNITVTSGNGISSVAATVGGWNNTGTATMNKQYRYGSEIDLANIVTPTHKNGYTGTEYVITGTSGTLSGTTYTVGESDGTITINATGIEVPVVTLKANGVQTATEIYNRANVTLSASVSNQYDNGITVEYKLSDPVTTNGPFNYSGVFDSIDTFTVQKNQFHGLRYYKVRARATGEGGITSSVVPSGWVSVELNQPQITFNATNGAALYGTSPLYVRYGSGNLYAGANSDTLNTVPSATKTGYDFDGWYTAASGGSRVYDSNGVLLQNVFGFTNADSEWIATEDKTLYAHWVPGTYTITVNAGYGVSDIGAIGWTENTNFTTITQTYHMGDTINLSEITVTHKDGYKGRDYELGAGSYGNLSGSTYTVGAGNGTITINATGLFAPSGVKITNGNNIEQVYNYQDITLTPSQGRTYDQTVTVYYEFSDFVENSDTTFAYSNGSTSSGLTVVKDAFLGKRYYKVRAYATDGRFTSNTTESTYVYYVDLKQMAVTFDGNTGTVSGTTPLYVRYGSGDLYDGPYSDTVVYGDNTSFPSATKTDSVLSGWYTQSSDGNRIYTANQHTLTGSTITGYTINSTWVATENKTLYAQWRSCDTGDLVTCTNGTGAQNCHVSGVVNNQCVYTAECIAGYNTPSCNTRDYCSCMPNTCTVTFKTGDTVLGTQNFTYGVAKNLSDISDLTNSTAATIPSSNEGWRFLGWATSSNYKRDKYSNNQSVDNLCVNGDVTLYGIWEREVMFKYMKADDSGNFASTRIIQNYYNTNANTAGVSSVNTPTTDVFYTSGYGWNMQGWMLNNPSGTNADISQTSATSIAATPAVNVNANYYALYTRSVSLTYNGNTSTSGSTSATAGTQYYNVNNQAQQLNMTLAQNGFTKTGYVFSDWASGSENGTTYSPGDDFSFPNRSWTSEEMYTMYAKWNQSCNTVTLNLKSGTMPDNISKLYRKTDGTTFYLDSACTIEYSGQIPTRSEYTFRGFFETSYDAVNQNDLAPNDQLIAKNGTMGSYNNSWNISSNATIYAAWAKNCTSSLNPGCDTCALNVANDGAVAYTITPNTGYTVTSDNTATPVCSANCNTVTLNLRHSTSVPGTYTELYRKTNGTTFYTDSLCENTYTVTSNTNMPTRPGYIFRGFFESAHDAVNQDDPAPDDQLIKTTGQTTVLTDNQNGRTNDNWEITSNATIYAAWARECKNNLIDCTCSLSVGTDGAVTYTTTGTEGHELTSGNGTYFPVCDANTISLEWKNGITGEDISGNPAACYYGETDGINPIVQPSIPGYTFTGWKLTEWR